MDEVKLLSSAAVLRVLFDAKKDIYDVLSEFIKATIHSKSLSAFNSMECVGYIEEEFGFIIPEAIIKSCLRKRLVKSNILSLKNGIYSVTESFRFDEKIGTEFENSRDEYNEIINRLYKYCSNIGLLNVDKKNLENDLEDYLIRPDKANKYTNDIAKFFIINENEPGFKEKINKIEEGLILYTGIRYSPDLSTLGIWRGNLTIFLDSEHLFSATGLNGPLYKTLFDDFYNLVAEINRNKRGGQVTLKYFEETDSAIESFYNAAQTIVEKKRSIDPAKTAMINICNGCKYPSDVVAKKADFLTKLSKLKIMKEKTVDYYSKPEFNIESTGVVEGLSEDIQDPQISSSEIFSVLKIFTKVNYLRSGENNIGIDRVAAIFLTDSWLPQRIAFSKHVFEGNGAIPFATNLEFMTEKLWFKLNKGFGGNSKPASFDPIIKAKITIASQISRSISNIYKSISEQYKAGKIDNDELAIIHHEIYNAPSTPDDVSIESISMSHEFLDESYIEKVIKEKSLLEKDAAKGRQAVNELRKIRHQQKQERLLPLKRVARRQYLLLQVGTYIAIPVLSLFLLIKSYTPNDTTLSIIFGTIGLFSLIIGIARPKSISNFYWSLSKKWYRKSINKSRHYQ